MYTASWDMFKDLHIPDIVPAPLISQSGIHRKYSSRNLSCVLKEQGGPHYAVVSEVVHSV